jgi:peptidoglycan/xylan/chitin deacetylase (PgdA/CDA1 family)
MTSPTIVLYHNIAGEPTPFERAIEVNTEHANFVAHLDYYQKNYDIIDCGTLLSGNLPRRPLLITFDDCYRSNLDVAQKYLKPRGIPAVLFTNPGLLGRDAVSLDQCLAVHSDVFGLDQLKSHLGVTLDGDFHALFGKYISTLGARDREVLRQKLLPAVLARPEFKLRSPIMTREEIALLPALGVEIGNHTSTHVHCRALDHDEMQDEFVASKQALEAITGRAVRTFSIPYGNKADLTPQVLEMVRKSGHAATFLVHAQSNFRRPAPDVWFRVSLRNTPVAALKKSLHILPMVRSLKNWFN